MLDLWSYATILVVLLACVVMIAEEAPAQQPGPQEVFTSGFEDGLRSWRTRGVAEFGVDRSARHGGGQSARITIGRATEPSYQQLQHDLVDARPGDVLEASCWVRTQGVDASPGAYMVLEHLDAGGRRLQCDHSTTGAGKGARGWVRLSVSGTVPEGAARVTIALILHAHGTAWFDDVSVLCTHRATTSPAPGEARQITVHTREVVHRRFGGVGFHVFCHAFTIEEDHLEQVVAKRWRELNPSFARLNHSRKWDTAKLDEVARHILRMKDTGTEIYLATWDPVDAKPGAERAAYAKLVVDHLEYLVRTKGATNIRYYCMTNELSLKGWGTLRRDLPKFKDYHQELYRQLRARRLDIKLLASDASPIASWNTIEWAAKNMDDITGIYGGHHYINARHPDDEGFYSWFLSEMTRGAAVARKMGKDFILGEFGCKQDGRVIKGVKMDACRYWGTPTEPLVGIQLAEAVIAALNGGIYALGNWTFMDFPDNVSKTYANKWGTFKWSGTDYSTRPHYYAYGLLAKFFRGPATVYRVESGDPRVRAAALGHHGRGTYSIAIVNRNRHAVDLEILLEGVRPTAAFRAYVYDPAAPPQHPFGDLQEPERTVSARAGRLSDSVGPGQLVVYTTDYDETPPAPVVGLQVGPRGRLSWRPSTDRDLCYYRVYRSESPQSTPSRATQIGSTVATEFVDTTAPPGRAGTYRVVAVDQSGNAGP